MKTSSKQRQSQNEDDLKNKDKLKNDGQTGGETDGKDHILSQADALT